MFTNYSTTIFFTVLPSIVHPSDSSTHGLLRIRRVQEDYLQRGFHRRNIQQHAGKHRI